MPPSLRVALTALLLVLSFALGAYVRGIGRAIPDVTIPDSRSVQSCTESMIKVIQPQPLDTNAVSNMITVCKQEIDSQNNLNEFVLRRLGFLTRSYADRITLWMVVIITLSGVFLAGLQLAASYRLAMTRGTALASDNEATVEEGKLVLRSSVTGLFVLLISLGFFLIYVKYIYVMPEVDVDAQYHRQIPATTDLLPGGLGKPPPADHAQPNNPTSR
jgi:hypothetical protein